MAKTVQKSVFSPWHKPLKSQCSPHSKNYSKVNFLPMAKTAQKSMFSPWQKPLKSQCSPHGKVTESHSEHFMFLMQFSRIPNQT
jgi:hypothetical protein